jgi:hypothetical protein
MPGKRIPDLPAIAGASTANDDNLVIYDTDASTTKRILRSQLAAGLVGDLPYTPSGGISATTVPTAIAELDSEAAKSATLAAAGGAALIGNTPAGTIAATTVQGAINEIVSDLAASSGASLVGYLSSFAGSVTTTVKNFLDRITSLDNGSAAHTDGSGNTITGSPRWFIGNNAPSTDDSALLIGRGLTGSYSSGAHAVRDETTYASSGAGLHAYASFDAIPSLSGSVNYNHLHAFQARPAYSGSGPMDQLAGFTFQANHTGSGTVTSVRGFRIEDCQGSGPITNQYGIWIDNLTRGASNFAFYSGNSALPSYHGGRWQMGTAPQITAAGFTTYGAILSHDSTGNLLTNPNLKIVNGTLSMGNATTSKVLSTSAANLELDAPVKVVSLKAHAVPTYTVATLPSPASAYTGCRANVSDATVTTFASVVAGGGANYVPVYSDGTNWRIG